MKSTMFPGARPSESASGDPEVPTSVLRSRGAPGNHYRWFDQWTRTADALTHSCGFAVRFLVRGEDGLTKVGDLKLPRGGELKIAATPEALKRLKTTEGGNYKTSLRRLVSEAQKFWLHEAEKR